MSLKKVPGSGKRNSLAVALLSGGIDSPVAISLMQDKLDIVAVHFHQLPLTDEKEVEKVKKLAALLGLKKLYLVPFARVLKKLVDQCDHRDYFILSKILMFQLAGKVLEKEKKFAENKGVGGSDADSFLITGENLAQVSSQTLSNLTSISSLVDAQILRPLLTYDKQEIVTLAKEIGTYDISKGPEICGLLGPKAPRTQSHVEKISSELVKLDLALVEEESLNKAEILEF